MGLAQTVEILIWSIFVLPLGACIGSFLNVIIYRWPRGMSAGEPLRSFCPECSAGIAWYDNLPIISYLRLRGRCRHCGKPISAQYPIVEGATALVFLIMFDCFFVAHERMGVRELPADAMILVGHWLLWAGLIALAVMDLEAYMVDIRVTWIISALALVVHGFWTPNYYEDWIRPGPLQAASCIAALLGLAIAGAIWLRHPPAEPPLEPDQTTDGPVEPGPIAVPEGASRVWLWAIIPALLVCGYVVWLTLAGEQRPLETPPMTWEAVDDLSARVPPMTPGSLRLAIGLAATFLGLALAASLPHTEADSGIVESIEAEAESARGVALQELKLVTPAVILGVAALILLLNVPTAKLTVERLLEARVYRDWRPALGISTAVTGWIIGGAVGWLARIGFTLLFGKEALGMGDVHILAAAGAVAGWPVSFLGFFLAAPLTLLAILVIRLRRQSRALPYGPWLALGFLIAAVFQDRILLYLGVRWLLA